MIELIVVITILAVISSVAYVNLSSNVDDSAYSNDNTKMAQTKQLVDRLWVKDF